MCSKENPAAIEWRGDGIPVSTRFDDPYFSLHDGLAESRHVFLAGNDLPHRLHAGFKVAELGFGTGLNLLALCLAAPQGLPISFTSFEAFPMSAAEMARALSHFPPACAVAPPLLAAWQAGRRSFQLGSISVEVMIGDAQETLPLWPHKADAWFLDGFSPAKNPALWNDAIMAEVARHTALNGTFATYTAAGHVRRALASAGFQVTRSAGHGRKRHMSKGVLHNAK